MSTQQTAQDLRIQSDDPLNLDAAYAYVAQRALAAGPVRRVGLELEGHLIDLAAPGRAPEWSRIRAAADAIGALAVGSTVTVEPGGQLELSTMPAAGAMAAIEALRRDEATARTVLADHGLGLVTIGADPVRPHVRVNPSPRYAAMETYFAATGNGTSGRAMMCATASLQINLDAGPAAMWSQRIQLAHQLGPVLVALSACSPLLEGRPTGWRSTRQRIWGTLDQARCGPLLAGEEPAREWAEYALHAPVMLVRDALTGDATPMSVAVPFSSWAAGTIRLTGRAPTVKDLDYHLTTLFPPVRLRGFFEIRYLDAVPARWWPALAAIVITLLDDPIAADGAAAATEPTAGAWTRAARDGLSDPDPALARAARQCLAAAVAAAPPQAKAGVEAYAELVASGRTPGDDVLDRAAISGPERAFREVVDA